MKQNQSLLEYLAEINDPRIDRAKKHNLIDILTIAICAVISGAEGWEHIEMFGRMKVDWLSSFLELPNGIPSHDTISRVFASIDSEQFQKAFIDWVNGIELNKKGKVIAIDGKSLRRSFDTSVGKGPLHMVSAWAVEAGISLGQLKSANKSNEITAIPRLLDLLDVSGAIVTIDAMGCQKEIAKKIRSENAHYILALKQNQPNLFNETKALFSLAKSKSFEGINHDKFESVDQNHGRLENRTCYCLSATEWFPEIKVWKDFKTVIMLESSRETGKTKTNETRFYISSLPLDAKVLLGAIRDHWGIENSLHWVLDMTFREDESRVRKDHAPENLATIRKTVLNLIKLNKPDGMSFKKAKLASSWDIDFAFKTVFGN